MPAPAQARRRCRCASTARFRAGVGAKDVVLALIAKIGVGGATGHVIEYRGTTVDALDMEERMTICNMSIEAGARAGMIAPDERRSRWLEGRRFAPEGEAWKAALARWQSLRTDEGATYDADGHARRRASRADDHVRHEPGDGRRR